MLHLNGNRVLWLAGAWVVLAMLVTAVSAAAQNVTLTYVTPVFGHWPAWGEATAALYEEMNPNVDVSVVPADLEKLQTMVAGGTPPDVISGADRDLRIVAYLGFLQELEPFIQKTPSFDLEAFIPSTLEALTYRGRLWALPQSWSSVAVAYNPQYFEERAIAVPDDDWTWDDLIPIGKKLTYDSDSDGAADHFGFGDIWPHVNRYPAVLWSFGGDFYNSDLTRVTVDSPNAMDAWRYMLDLRLSHHIAPVVAGSNEPLDPGLGNFSTRGNSLWTELFTSGHLAMFLATRYFTGEMESQVGVLQLPTGRAGKSSVLSVSWHGIGSATRRPNEAWDFLQVIASEEGFMVGVDVTASSANALSALRDVALRVLEGDQADINAINWFHTAAAGRAAHKHPAVRDPIRLREDVLIPVTYGEKPLQAAIGEYVTAANVALQDAWESGKRW